MGTYVLNLLTKGKVVPLLDGTKVEIFTYKYSHKYSVWGDTPAHIYARQARLRNAWERRPCPKYVCWSEEFECDTTVFAVPDDLDVMNITDGRLSNLPIAGKLRFAPGKKGGRPRRYFEPWRAMTVETENHPEVLQKIMRGPWSYVRQPMQMTTVSIYARDEADLVMAKLALV